MNKLTIAVDCDDVLIPSTARIIDLYNAKYNASVDLKDAYNSDNISSWLSSDELEITDRIFEIQLSSDFKTQLPFEDAIEVCRRISTDHDMHLVTARAGNLLTLTLDMLNTYFPNVFKEIEHIGFQASKGEVCRNLRSDILIDDRYEHLMTAKACGISNLIWFGNYPWQGYDTDVDESVIRCSNWHEVEREVRRIASS